MHKFSFEKLIVWQDARLLTKNIYKTTKTFPDEERFGLTNQLRRAMISVCSNLAEGSSRAHSKEQTQFYQIAYSSLMEALNQIIIAFDLEYIDLQSYETTRSDVEKCSRLINSLRNSTRKILVKG
jgi:four helix bundle protein